MVLERDMIDRKKMWRKPEVPTRREMHKDRDCSNSVRKEAAWTRIVKEKELNSAPHCRKNLHHSHQLCLGVASAPLSGDIFPTSFVPEWSTLKAHFCSSSEETAGICLCGREL